MLMEIKKTAEFLKTNTNFNPKIGVILGTGLGGLVDEIDIKFSVKMLNWPKGNRPSDGVWSSHWYKNVVNSDGFMSYKEPLQDLKKEHIDIFKECMYHYNYLNSFKI